MGVLNMLCEAGALEACLVRASENDAVLFMENGVNALIKPSDLLSHARPKLYALQPDLDARGIALSGIEIHLIDYAGFVDLSIAYSMSQSWR